MGADETVVDLSELFSKTIEPLSTVLGNVITGAVLLVGNTFEMAAVDKLGVEEIGTTMGVVLLAVVCEPIAVQGGPPGQPVITN
jgi:hypothetical protein